MATLSPSKVRSYFGEMFLSLVTNHNASIRWIQYLRPHERDVAFQALTALASPCDVWAGETKLLSSSENDRWPASALVSTWSLRDTLSYAKVEESFAWSDNNWQAKDTQSRLHPRWGKINSVFNMSTSHRTLDRSTAGLNPKKRTHRNCKFMYTKESTLISAYLKHVLLYGREILKR